MKKHFCAARFGIKAISAAIGLLTALSLLLSFAGCGSQKDENALVVGMECGYAPYNYTQKDDADGAVKISNAQGYANGYDVMIAKKVAEKLGKTLVIEQYEFDSLINAVNAGSIDLIIAGMSPRADRMESIDFSDPYYDGQLVIVVRKDGKFKDATCLDDFNGAKIVAQSGTYHDDVLQEQAAEHGIIAETPLKTFPLMINALDSRAVDGYVAEEPGATADCATNKEFTFIKLENNSTGFKVSDSDTKIAIGLKKGNAELRNNLNAALAEISEEERLTLIMKATDLAVKNAVELVQTKSVFAFMGDIIVNYYDWILQGVGYTLLVALVGTIMGLLIGLLIGVYRTIPTLSNKVARWFKRIGDWILTAYIEVFRGTPMMVQAMVIYWGFALLNGGRRLDVLFSGLFIVSINTGAYMAEIVRGGIISVDKGQFEGAQALGMSHFKTMTHVILPQAMRNILPSIANEFVINIKDTSVLNVIGFTELYFFADKIASKNYQVFATYLLVAAIYFVLTFAITRILRFIEKKLDGNKDYAILGSQNLDAESFVREAERNGSKANNAEIR